MKEDLKYPSNSLYYSAPSKMIETHVKNEEARRLIDNKIWTRDELKKLRGKTARSRDRAISNTLKQIHKPWHQRSTDNVEEHSGTILFDLT